MINVRKIDHNLPTISYGYALYDKNTCIEDAIHNADLSMYAYKNKTKL